MATEPGAAALAAHADLWDWRRRVAALYAEIRALEPPRLGWQLWRETRDELFRSIRNRRWSRRPAGPSRACRCSTTTRPCGSRPASCRRRSAPVTLSGGGDGAIRITPFARTLGLERRLGGELTLYWIAGYGGGAFLPFQDATSGRETYGGGRYLLDTIKGADLGQAPDGRMILDFNFAYNPSCAYSDRWICPLAPAANLLPAAVRAGERMR